ncbi:CaiB/BaiF CoA transferase family protein [Alterinioella nitratireducens]|uniref:CaiB/BaiF CoA transferase family protein n=1 Tax=Alterinioella nitratireducens TaxID=2735915 RepID=UPI00155248C6|nr:CoA transferase [Alterinioella nitratireducens]NPD21495.1 CoA transferase [Alterinioella nitratireducens]
MRRPLDGVTVIDLGQIYNGPYATFLMAMAGAKVIKIEPPEGEKMRRRGAVGGAMLPFAMLNSNKQFVTLNLKSPVGLALLHRMVAKADIVLENFAPGTMDRLGAGYETLRALNPRLIYAAGTGYGSYGPNRDMLAMDLTVQAMAGVMASTGFPDRPPVKAGPALCDFFGGIHLYGAVMTALVRRERTGEGSQVEVSMLESVYPALSSTLGLYYGLGGENPPRTGNRHGGMAEAPYNVYPCSDGWVAMLCVSDKHWEGLAAAMGRPDMLRDPRFVDLQARVNNIDALDTLIGEWTGSLTKDALVAVLRAQRIPYAPVREIDEVVNDAHMHARGTLRRVDHPDLGTVVLPAGPMIFPGSEGVELVPSKGLGADNAVVYGDWLGVSPEELVALVEQGVI